MPGALALANACSQESVGADEFTIEDYRNSWGDPARDIATDTRIAETADGTIVGCVELWNNAPYVSCWIWGCVHPEFRGHGIGTALIDWAEDRARVTLDRAPAGTRVVLEVSTSSFHQPSIDLLSERGFRAVRHRASLLRELAGDLPAPIWPAGITVRTMQPGEELALYRAKNEAFRDHWAISKRLSRMASRSGSSAGSTTPTTIDRCGSWRPMAMRSPASRCASREPAKILRWAG